ncbi:uncharacterized protein FOMMEDRAFT_134522 [Fomitiporia mediterranea MF3/22]|uniref:uncharacterized protein n=1 Tax=Fomitiporia mediterranea (strain MF3/22) TaxID=694068 RepID=UPI0004407C87|nr:uncharacterized protein FOMMEDRAFT_134522 [Fomitiporia mediterranea MF3/22]EJD01863.1 hypothetical protein FOMMEDRAFT_134522 [Fomitiporia mediterranea MF3/22]
MYQHNVSTLMAAKARPFSISGHIPLDPKALMVFFRSQSGITHALDFPIDVEVEAPPSLDVLIAACKPHATCEMDGFSDRESLYYPPNLSLTTTLELAGHPILEAIRTTLFPRLASGQYLVAVRDVMQLVPTGGHMCPQRRLTQEEGKVATLVVTLPVRFRGGALTVHDFEGNEEKYYGRGGKPGDLEWTAFLADCDHEVETVHRGVRLTISYNVLLRTYGPSPSPSQSLMLPSDRFLDLIAPILNMSRGQHIAFYLREQYGCSPADALAESLVPNLKGGDALLYHSLRLYKLTPELRWAAGGYIWPVDSTVQCGNFFHNSPRPLHNNLRSPLASTKQLVTPGGRTRRIYSGIPRKAITNGNGNGFSSLYHEPGSDSTDEDELDDRHDAVILRTRVEESGAMPIAQTGIRVLADDTLGVGDSVTKERVPYISAGGLEKLIINVLLVVYVP